MMCARVCVQIPLTQRFLFTTLFAHICVATNNQYRKPYPNLDIPSIECHQICLLSAARSISEEFSSGDQAGLRMRDDDCSTSSVATVVAAVPVNSQIRQPDGGTISTVTLVPAATHKPDNSGKSDSSSGSSGGGKDPKRDKEREERDEGV